MKIIQEGIEDVSENWSLQDQDYLDYMGSHIDGVVTAYNQLVELGAIEYEEDIYSQILDHDQSKYSDEEWSAYRDKFYTNPHTSGDEYSEADFEYAWLHHLHNNPHHHQYWNLKNDDGTLKALDMPERFIIEMVCDWHSFRVMPNADPEYDTTYEWYQDHKDSMLLSESTRAKVEELLEYLK